MFAQAIDKYERLNAETLVYYQEEQNEILRSKENTSKDKKLKKSFNF